MTLLNPGWSKAKCFQESAKLISPVATWDGQKIIPPHSTGGALDIEVIDEKCQLIDFGMAVKDWYLVEPGLCETRVKGLTETVKKNREMLVEILEAEGFVNYPREWWHFSYGDQYWAFLSGQEHALYDCVELP